MTRIIAVIALAAGLGLAMQAAVAQEKLPTTAEVLAKLKEKRDSGGVQRYKLKFERGWHLVDRKDLEERELLIDWKTGKFRQYVLNGWDSKPYELIEVFDGDRIKTRFRDITKDGKPVGNGAWKYGILTGRRNSWVFQREFWPIFFHKGVIAGLDDQYYPTHLCFDADEKEFFVDCEVVRNGRKCLSLKTFPIARGNPVQAMKYEYIVDPKRDYAVLWLMYSRGDSLFLTTDIDVDEAKERGGWPVRGWTYTSLDGRGQPGHSTTVKVTGFEDNVKIGPEDPFDIVPPEGAEVGRSHHVVTRDLKGEWHFKIIPFKYVVKNGKLVQTAGPEMTPEWWLTDNLRALMWRTMLPAAMAAPRLSGWQKR